MAVTGIQPTTPAARVARLWIGSGAVFSVVGVIACILSQPEIGGWVLVAGVLGGLLGLHRLGRSGTD